MLNQSSAKIFTTSKQIQIENESPILLNISAYPNCIFVLINQTQSIGSIMRGTAEIQTESSDHLDFDYENDENDEENGKNENKFIYECKTIFGSTQIQFYDLIMRRLIQLIFEQRKMCIESKGERSKVFLNIGIKKAHHQQFQNKQKVFYDKIIEALRELLEQVI